MFHRPAWLRAVETGAGQRARGLVAETGGAVTGWLPLTEVHSPVFGRMLASSGFAVGGGALAERDETALALCRAAKELAARLSCPTIELRGGVAPPDWRVSLPDLRTRLAVTPVARIEQPDDALFAAIVARLFADRGLYVAAEALRFIAARVTRDYWTAERLVEVIDRFALAQRARLTVPTIRRALREAAEA